MKKKLLHVIFGICTLSGFLFALGTAGGSDCGMIDFKTSLIRASIAVALILVGVSGLRLSGCKYII